jgi:hypothetical protein
MGEPPTFIERSVERTYRLRRLYYDDAPVPHDAMELGQAVAASACVPGLFRPIVLNGLYPDRIVRLVDGGVHDNQGVFGLLEQDCRIMLISDGSGQMAAVDDPPWWGIGVPKRTNEILMAAIRRSYYRILDDRRRSLRLREMMYVHMKNDLDVEDVTWIRPGHPRDKNVSNRGYTSYNIPRAIQLSLAKLRTDLDRFSENEAYALMLSGYRIAGQEFANGIKSVPVSNAPAIQWDFLKIADILDAGDENQQFDPICEELRCGEHLLFRSWRSRATWFRGLFKRG